MSAAHILAEIVKNALQNTGKMSGTLKDTSENVVQKVFRGGSGALGG
jgi:hypothetical protein